MIPSDQTGIGAMWFFLSKAIWMVLRPSNAILLVAIGGFLLVLRAPRFRLGMWLLTAGLGSLAACAALPLGDWLLRPLEERFPQPANLGGSVDGIIVLGGAIDLPLSAERGQPALNSHAERIVKFVVLARRYPAARLVMTGGNPDAFANANREADFGARVANELGISPRRIVLERSSRNTHEDAVLSVRLVRPTAGQRWLLVTSAADMPRAVGCFRTVGWMVVPVPVDYRTARGFGGWAPGLAAGLERLDWASHEWIGLLYYRLRGWTSALFPGPQA